MDERDIIIAAFACGGKMKCSKEAQKFKEPPLVINVPGGSSSGFRRTAQSYRKNHSVLDNFLAMKAKKIKPRRICLISFSAGWAWSTEVLRASHDLDRIDTVIVMDGIHTPSLNGWVNYATKCAQGGENSPKLWMAHTQIKPPFISAKKTNTKIINSARKSVDKNTPKLVLPEYIWHAEIEKPISVYSKIERPRRKIYHKDPLETFEHVGNVARFEYEGGKAQDHIYNAQYTQPRFWQWLKEIWSNNETGVFWK